MSLFRKIFHREKDEDGLHISFSFSSNPSEKTDDETLLEELEEELENLEYEQSELEDLLSDLDFDPPEEGTASYRRWQERKVLFESQIKELEQEIDHLRLRVEDLELFL